jgi:hypothetical protein
MAVIVAIKTVYLDCHAVERSKLNSVRKTRNATAMTIGKKSSIGCVSADTKYPEYELYWLTNVACEALSFSVESNVSNVIPPFAHRAISTMIAAKNVNDITER